MPRHMVLNYVLASQGGFPWEAWRHPEMDVTRVDSLEFHFEQARLAEAGRFDALFTVDSRAQFHTPDAALYFNLDPVQVLTAIAAHTEHIGLIATIGTSYWAPYAVARQLATLDHLSKGRAGWNIVTSASDTEARNHGLGETADRAVRYGRVREFIDACLQLRHSWEPDALTADRTQLVPVGVEKIHAINYSGEHHHVAGALGTPRSPQTVPLLFQAGPSPAGREIAASYADLVYAAYSDPDEGRAYRKDLSERAVASGRPDDAIKVVPNLVPFVKSTEAEAKAFRRELIDLAPEDSIAAQAQNVVVGTPEQVADHKRARFRTGRVRRDHPRRTDPVQPGRLRRHRRPAPPGSRRPQAGVRTGHVAREAWTAVHAAGLT